MLGTLLAIVVIVVLVSLLGYAVLLWLGCKLCRVSATFRRALFLTLGVAATNLLIGGVWLALGGASRDSLPEALGVAALQLVLILAWLQLGLRVKLGRAFLILVVWLPLSAVFAAGLVLAIKSTLTEAFIIPTGAMAETVLGYHKKVACPQCGLVFPVNASGEANPPPGHRIVVTHCSCPNCRADIDLLQSPNPPPLEQGDRVLTTKGFLNGSFESARGEVIVFDYPLHKDRTGAPIRYIKRLIGLPGETIAIQGGKLFVLSPDRSPDYQADPDAPLDVQGQGTDPFEREQQEVKRMHPSHPKAMEKFKQGQFQILRKPPEQVLTLRWLVYDNDHLAKDLEGKVPPRWSGKGWKEEGTGFEGAGGEGNKFTWLRYHHLLRDSPDKPLLITDFIGYNSGGGGQETRHWARDLILGCEVTIAKAEGELVLELARGVDRFQAQFDLADGTCKLVRIGEDGKPKELGSARTDVQKGTYQLRLADVDERLLLWVNDKLVIPDGVVFEPPANPCPTNNDLEPASIGIKGTSIQLKHLKLWRDTYYTSFSPREGDFDPAKPDTWGSFKEMPVQTFFVRPGHYFCLGDNSPHSADSRAWGLVPAPLLLGRAVLVYYPPARWGWIR